MEKNKYAEAKVMAGCILQGYTEKQIAEEFGVSISTVRKRLNLLGVNANDLIAYRKKRKKGSSF